MTIGLNQIAEELRRLQRNGTDRVFVSDAVLATLRKEAALNGAPVRNGQPATSVSEEELKKAAAMLADTLPKAKVSSASSKTVAKPAPSAPVERPYPPAPKLELPQAPKAEQLAWLKDQVLGCEESQRHLRPHGKLVFGEGAINADLCFVGEAPGADEDRVGRPFVGKAGQLLDKIIQATGLQRDAVYIANILTWRPEHPHPTGNRPPTQEEMTFCLPYLLAQLQIVQPKVIVALGNSAVNGLLGHDPKRRLGDVRGTWQSFQGTPLMVTFHPSYLLRNGTLRTKRTVWEDILKVMEKLDLPISEKQRGFFLPKA